MFEMPHLSQIYHIQYHTNMVSYRNHFGMCSKAIITWARAANQENIIDFNSLRDVSLLVLLGPTSCFTSPSYPNVSCWLNTRPMLASTGPVSSQHELDNSGASLIYGRINLTTTGKTLCRYEYS